MSLNSHLVAVPVTQEGGPVTQGVSLHSVRQGWTVVRWPCPGVVPSPDSLLTNEWGHSHITVLPSGPLSPAGSAEAGGRVGVAHIAASKKPRPSGLHLPGAEFCQQARDLEVGPSPAEPLGEIPALLAPLLQPERAFLTTELR